MFLFFWVSRNQTENGIPTQKSYWLFFLNGIALPESSEHLSYKKLEICVPDSLKKGCISPSQALVECSPALYWVWQGREDLSAAGSGPMAGLEWGLLDSASEPRPRLTQLLFPGEEPSSHSSDQALGHALGTQEEKTARALAMLPGLGFDCPAIIYSNPSRLSPYRLPW